MKIVTMKTVMEFQEKHPEWDLKRSAQEAISVIAMPKTGHGLSYNDLVERDVFKTAGM